MNWTAERAINEKQGFYWDTSLRKITGFFAESAVGLGSLVGKSDFKPKGLLL